MKEYHVLWIDDQIEKYGILIKTFKMYHITVTPCKYTEDGLKILKNDLNKWSGVILDAKCLLNENSQVDTLKGLSMAKTALEQMRSSRFVPYYIYTGQPDLLSNEVFIQTYGSFYDKNKPSDFDRLISDIISGAEEMLINQYPDIFSLSSDIVNDLLSILPFLDPSKSSDPSVFNMIRKVLDWVMRYCNKSGVLMTEFNGSNLDDCSKELTHELVPIGVQRSFHSCVKITNEASHRLSIDESVKNGQAPYMIRSTIYELLNILHWCGTLPTDEKGRSEMIQKVTKLLDQRHEQNNETETKEGIVELDNGCYHVGDCLISYKNNTLLGQKVVIKKIVENKKESKDIYPFYANQCILAEK